ncbi:hypothetical protein JL722_1910 [Aureococcus anophagefferens]|nr:hypothetical protein JL722_1910 [Aureococcus anophagefferens]
MGSSQSSASSRNDELLGFSYVSHDVAGVPHEHRFSVDSTWGVVESRRALDGPSYDAARDRYTHAFLAAGGGREPAASQFAATRDAWRDYAGSRGLRRRVSSAAPPAAAAAEPAAPESRVDRDDECVVCLDAASNVEFDCLHVVTCAGCAMKLDACPVCRAPIRTRTPVLTCS